MIHEIDVETHSRFDAVDITKRIEQQDIFVLD